MMVYKNNLPQIQLAETNTNKIIWNRMNGERMINLIEKINNVICSLFGHDFIYVRSISGTRLKVCKRCNYTMKYISKFSKLD